MATDPKAPGAASSLCLFDRDRSAHPWGRALQEPSTISEPGKFWVAANWRLDHRVSENREASDLDACGYFDRIADAEGWWEARGHYFKGEICRSSQPSPGRRISAYARSLNGNNRIAEPPADFDRLVHVTSLDALLFRFNQGGAGARTADVELEFRAIVGRPWLFERTLSASSPNFVQAVANLVQELTVLGEEAVRRLAGLLVGALGETEPPWWACFVQEIQETLDKADAAQLCSALGLGHRTDGEWLLTWNYPVGVAGPLYRPTVLEANDSPYHYPSPPLYPLGITMPLDPAQPACREVLHRPLRGMAAVEGCTGRLLRLESFAALGDRRTLGSLRSHHRERLKREFSGVDRWIERHPEPLEFP